MRAFDFSPEGMSRFALLLEEAMDEAGLKAKDLAKLLGTHGHTVSVSAINRHRPNSDRDRNQSPSLNLIWGLSRLGFLKRLNNTPYTLEELLLICSGQLELEERDIPNSEAVKFMRSAIESLGLTPEQFGDRCEIPDPRLLQILHGEAPAVGEMIAMTSVFPRPVIDRLLILYGVRLDAPIPANPEPA